MGGYRGGSHTQCRGINVRHPGFNGVTVENIATEYLRKILYRDPIKSWMTNIDTTTLSMRSTPITTHNIIETTPNLSL